jgi:hypothetical protein
MIRLQLGDLRFILGLVAALEDLPLLLDGVYFEQFLLKRLDLQLVFGDNLIQRLDLSVELDLSALIHMDL